MFVFFWHVFTLQGVVSREYALFCNHRFVAQARGEQEYTDKGPMTLATALEAAKSNALMRCCKDIGIASELWDPTFTTKWRSEHCVHVWAENREGKKRKLWRRKNALPLEIGGWCVCVIVPHSFITC